MLKLHSHSVNNPNLFNSQGFLKIISRCLPIRGSIFIYMHICDATDDSNHFRLFSKKRSLDLHKFCVD